MNRVRRRAAAVLLGVVGAAATVFLEAPPTAAVAVPLLYAGIGYYATAHARAILGRERSSPDWTTGAYTGGTTLALVGLVNAEVQPWLWVLGFGLATFGFVTGVAYGREGGETDDATA